MTHLKSCDSEWIFLSRTWPVFLHIPQIWASKLGTWWIWYEFACQTHCWTVNDKEKEINAIQPCFTSFHDFAFLDCRTGTKSLVILCSDRYPIRYLFIHKNAFNIILMINPWIPFQYLSTLYFKMIYLFFKHSTLVKRISSNAVVSSTTSTQRRFWLC